MNIRTSAFALLPAALLLLSGCAQLTLTVRNDRPTAVKDVQVKAGDQAYTVARLEPGATDMRKLKPKAPGDLNVNYGSESGGVFYTSAPFKVKKGDGRKILLKLTEKTLLDASEEK